jgi:hypothetical protein
MGILTSEFSRALINEMVDNIVSNTSQYFAFVANPIPVDANTIAPVANNTYEVNFENNWLNMFGKRLANGEVSPIINKYVWDANTVYTRWDNTQDLGNSQFYTITVPEKIGGDYQLYVCIDNANGAPSNYAPRLKQATTFQTYPDGYKWRYLSSIRSNIWDEYYTEFFAPIVANATIQSTAAQYSGIEVIPVLQTGINYSAWSNGYIQEVINSTALVLEITANNDPGVFVDSSMYLYSVANNAYKLANIKDYVVAGNNYKFVILDREIEVNKVIPRLTQYTIQPRVKITSDATPNLEPEAITFINAVTNSISYIQVLNPGSNVSWANVEIIANSSYGNGAVAYCIIPPPGGHGANPASQCGIQALEFAWYFEQSEDNTIPTDCGYNKIGIVRNPVALVSNSSGFYKGNIYKGNTYNQIFQATLDPEYTFANNQQVIGANSKSLGVIVSQSNSTTLSWIGDYTFKSGEALLDPLANSLPVTNITITKRPQVYLKDQYPLYVQNINNVTRSNSQSETYRLVIQL